jgi:hypothetical protein
MVCYVIYASKHISFPSIIRDFLLCIISMVSSVIRKTPNGIYIVYKIHFFCQSCMLSLSHLDPYLVCSASVKFLIITCQLSMQCSNHKSSRPCLRRSCNQNVCRLVHDSSGGHPCSSFTGHISTRTRTRTRTHKHTHTTRLSKKRRWSHFPIILFQLFPFYLHN